MKLIQSKKERYPKGLIYINFGTIAYHPMFVNRVFLEALKNNNRDDGFAVVLSLYSQPDAPSKAEQVMIDDDGKTYTDANAKAMKSMSYEETATASRLEVPGNFVFLHGKISPNLSYQLINAADVFVSNCGRSSMMEAYETKTPIFAVPINGDQIPNADKIVEAN